MSDDKQLRLRYRGLVRTAVCEDGAYWAPTHLWEDPRADDWKYGIAEYPFVPGYNVIEFVDSSGAMQDEHVISNHKTLTEAKAILMILLATPGAITYED